MPALTLYEEHQDPAILHAIREIFKTYGDKVSVTRKAKSLRKFGRTLNADAGVKTTVALFQDSEVQETFATGNTIDYVVSDSASDVGKTVLYEGHTINETTGAKTFFSSTVTLNGTTPVALPVAGGRLNRAKTGKGTFASPATNLVGNVYFYDSTVAGGVTAGVPDDATATKLMIAAGKQQTEKCATSLSYKDYFIVTDVYAAVTRDGPQSAKVDLDVEYREVGGVFLPLGFEVNLEQGVGSDMPPNKAPYAIIPKDSDIALMATSDTDNTQISGYINGYLAEVYD